MNKTAVKNHSMHEIEMIIEVSGGTVQAVYTDGPMPIRVRIVDHDNLRERCDWAERDYIVATVTKGKRGLVPSLVGSE